MLGEKINKSEILIMCMEQMGIKEKFQSINQARELIAEVLMTEVSKKEWGHKEIKEAIEKEILNMKTYGVFGERIKERSGIEIIGTRLIVTKSQKQDSQRAKYEALCVGQGFKESEKA